MKPILSYLKSQIINCVIISDSKESIKIKIFLIFILSFALLTLEVINK